MKLKFGHELCQNVTVKKSLLPLYWNKEKSCLLSRRWDGSCLNDPLYLTLSFFKVDGKMSVHLLGKVYPQGRPK